MDEKDKKSELAQKEEEILKFWQDNKIFEQTLAKNDPHSAKVSRGTFVFYDGPPFATGLPHYGHLIGGTIKDVIPRYKTMQGYHVSRRWGWDCHGLPVENLIEKELDLKTKKEIEDYGIGNFNEKARESVMRYADEWKKIVPRLGRFVDMDNDYRTMDPSYTESIWWIFKNLYDQGLIYEGYKAMQICPRCETTLSNFEVNQGYKDITDISVYVKFELVDDSPSTSSGQARTYVLAWTTTPWTLPGNVALAVGADLKYVVISVEKNKYILLAERLENLKNKLFADQEVVIEKEITGADLIGKKYKALFNYYTEDKNLKDRENGWQIYGADFVTTEDGTGVVHIAPAFGEDDMKLGQKENLPFVQHVAMNGTFKPEVGDGLAGLRVKPIENPQATDIEIIKILAAKGSLLAKEKIVHSYPHCWRCETPLLNYATSSWFVEVTKIKDKLVAENKKINWVPEHIQEGRFGKWLEGARDWAISRTRFWGAPLPVWRCEACQEKKVFGSLAELQAVMVPAKNNYWIMRHGEAESNLGDSISSDPLAPNHLIEKGKDKVKESAQKLKGEKIDLIISSDFVRTKETAEIMAEELGLTSDQIVFDERLREINPGSFTGKSWGDYNDAFGERINRLNGRLPGGGENFNEVRRRVMAVLYEFEQKYQGKKILVITHGLPAFMIQATVDHWDDRATTYRPYPKPSFEPGDVRAVNFAPIPHNNNYELDYHRPYIDDIEMSCACGGQMKRVPDVFDCWFESGSMPYGQNHYPFEKEKGGFDPTKQTSFPADFIAEGQDQTRGWFYTMLIIGTALFGQSPYKNVVVNGLVLAEDGQKMSKHLKNYPDPLDLVNKYSADVLRLYLMASPAVHAEDLNFSEKGVGEIQRKIISRLLNVVTFLETYGEVKGGEIKTPKTDDILDQWILSRLGQTIAKVEKEFEGYELDRAVWALDDFIDDLSNWYLRRSRDRFVVTIKPIVSKPIKLCCLFCR
jgi:isoleucyl-tRNA synthetase